MKRAFLVLGAESTGTRLLTSQLLAAGCSGDASHEQPYDNGEFENADPIVWRRSFPWTVDRLWPDIGTDLLPLLHANGYSVTRALVTTRDWYAIAKSQVRQQHVSSEAAALKNVTIAYHEIFRQLAQHEVETLVVSYEAMTSYKELAVCKLLGELGLDPKAQLHPIQDEGRKYYDVE
jgi:LPS sulfotransferase NodH